MTAQRAPTGPDLPSSTGATDLKEYQADLVRVLGPVVGGAALVTALGFPSSDACRTARARTRLPIPTFSVAGRRGRFAATADIAAWLWTQRQGRGDA